MQFNTAKQITGGFYMKYNTGVKRVKRNVPII